MYKRTISEFLEGVSKKYPVVTVVGPRQSGKSTLVRNLYKDHEYLSLEVMDVREKARKDPRSFLDRHKGKLILDEIQRVPELMSYIQTLVDEPKSRYHFVLTGSHNILLMEKVTQSLAGRTVIAKLLPFSRTELWSRHSKMKLDDFLLTGGYPRIYDKKLDPTQWLSGYYQTYIERDVRSLLKIAELDQFEKFIRLCAGRVGQLLNLSSLANDCGITQPTAKAWLSVLKASFICFTLKPHFRNFNKRIIKTPKLYFYDTGLVCYLLQIRNTDILSTYPLRGNIFENWIISETIKSYYNRGEEPPLYFWQDAKGHEVDMLKDEGTILYPSEIKSSSTFNSAFIDNMNYFNGLQKTSIKNGPVGNCYYGGEESFEFKGYQIKSWKEV